MMRVTSSPSAGERSRRASLRGGMICVSVICGSILGQPAAAEQKMLSVDWKQPDIKAFVADAAAGARSAMPQEEGRLSKLKLPVLGFSRPPAELTSQLARSLGPTAAAPPQRSLVMDEDNPVWYQLTEQYDGIMISIDADLRLQAELPPSAKVFGGLPAPDSTTPISVVDGTTEPGMTGAVAEYTVYKYPNIPYRVTIECDERMREYCRNPASIVRDKDTLQLISARPPQQ